LFWGDDCDTSVETKKPLRKRKSTREVRTMSCKDSIANAAVERHDEWEHTVLSRVDPVIDLVDSEAKYHGICYSNVFKLPSEHQPGRPQDTALAKACEKLFSYSSENDECQYSIDELFQKLKQCLPHSAELCSEKTFKRKLKEHFKEDALITSTHGKTSVVCFKDTGFILKNAWYEQRLHNPEAERLRS